MFTPYNPNPRGINTGDCVIRAICKAMDKTWEKVHQETLPILLMKFNKRSHTHVQL